MLASAAMVVVIDRANGDVLGVGARVVLGDKVDSGLGTGVDVGVKIDCGVGVGVLVGVEVARDVGAGVGVGVVVGLEVGSGVGVGVGTGFTDRLQLGVRKPVRKSEATMNQPRKFRFILKNPFRTTTTLVQAMSISSSNIAKFHRYWRSKRGYSI